VATKEKHIRKAEHNERFVDLFDIDTTPFLDWAITGIFYSAIHYIRALAAKHSFINISTYGEMDNLFNRISVFKNNRSAYVDYRQLKDDSRTARYEMIKFSTPEVRSLKNGEFQRIKSFVLANI